MKKLLWLLPFLSIFAPQPADAAACFYVNGSGSVTWDNTNGGGGTGTRKWASTSGDGSNANCAATSGPVSGVPGPSDNVTFDASSCTATCTVTIATTSYTGCASGLCIGNLTIGAFGASAGNTGTLDNSVNNVSPVITGSFNNSGSGFRILKPGTGTFTLTLNSGTVFTQQTLGPNGSITSAPNITFACAVAAANARTINLGTSLSYGTVTFADAVPCEASILFTTATTFATWNVTGPASIDIPSSAATLTVSNPLAWTGTGANPILLRGSSSGVTANIVVPVGSANTWTWTGFRDITFSNSTAGTQPSITATNSMNYGNIQVGGSNPPSTPSITPPVTGGGGGGGFIIGG